MPSAFAVMAPYVNSYRRYVKDHAAPSIWNGHVTTARQVFVSHSQSPDARRVENRLAGMDCNPYLCIAASLACGYLGLTRRKASRQTIQRRCLRRRRRHPARTWARLWIVFDEATALHEVLGPDFARVYSIVKRAEYEEFLQVISPWEREHLLLNV